MSNRSTFRYDSYAVPIRLAAAFLPVLGRLRHMR